jgi:hypothetical protein
VCSDDTHADHLENPDSRVLYDFEPTVLFDLEPVDSVVVTTLMDNVTDMFMPDQGPAHRPPLMSGCRQSAATLEGGDVPSALIAEHGFSVLVTVSKERYGPHPLRCRSEPRRRDGEHAPARYRRIVDRDDRL